MKWLKKYHAYFHNGRLVPSIDENGKQDFHTIDWDESMDDKTFSVGFFDTMQEALDAIQKSEDWERFNSGVIETEEDGECWSNTAEYSKCSCCGHERYNNFVSLMPWAKEYLEKGI